jgi:hypothetical protein
MRQGGTFLGGAAEGMRRLNMEKNKMFTMAFINGIDGCMLGGVMGYF